MASTKGGIRIDSSAGQSEKVHSWIAFNSELDPNHRKESEEHRQKQNFPIKATEAGTMIDFNATQS
jgi:hypothetical protein